MITLSCKLAKSSLNVDFSLYLSCFIVCRNDRNSKITIRSSIRITNGWVKSVKKCYNWEDIRCNFNNIGHWVKIARKRIENIRHRERKCQRCEESWRVCLQLLSKNLSNQPGSKIAHEHPPCREALQMFRVWKRFCPKRKHESAHV